VRLALKKLFFVLLLVSTVVILGFGKWHYDDKIEKDGINAAKAFKKEEQKEIQKEKERVALLEKNKSNSVIDWLKNKSTQKEKITISVFGSSVTAGAGSSVREKTWASLITNYLKNQEGISSISLVNRGYGGYSTDRLKTENKIKEVLTDKPDLVIIEPTIINNYLLDISIKQTQKDVLYFISQIKEKYPNSLIIIQSSDRIIGAERQNQLGYRYKDYVDSIKTFTQENHLNYIDIYAGTERQRKESNKSLQDILKDDRHPNDLGYKYWFETLKTSFKKTHLISN
jgi:lysophospholipase L1-like esterase